MTTNPTNSEMLANVITILEFIKDNEEVLNNYENFKKLMSDVTDSAMKGNNTLIVKKKKELTPYNEFVKAKMPEVSDLPKNEKFSRIAEIWKKYKALNWNKPNLLKKPKEAKSPKKTAKKSLVDKTSVSKEKV
jgi:16S rRNA C1402 (ribose-2'-O) methylase RsmI